MCTKKLTPEDKKTLALFKNDLMQLVVDCKINKYRSKVRLRLNKFTKMIGMETFFRISGNKASYQLL